MKELIYALVCVVLISMHAAAQSSGLIFDSSKDYNDVEPAALPLGGDNSPIKKKDLSDFFPQIRDQKKRNSCVGWALGYYLRSFQENAIHDLDISQEKNTFSPYFIYNSLTPKNNHDCSSGIKLSKALRFLKDKGAVQKSHFDSEDCTIRPDHSVFKIAEKFRIADYNRLPDVNNLSYYKLFINSHYPIVVAAKINQKFKDLKKGEILTDFSNPIDAHALLVVGYDETSDIKKFKVINSYGTDWGDDGFGWIEYNAFRNMIDQAWIAYPDEESDEKSIQDIDKISIYAERNLINSNQSFFRFWIEAESDEVFKTIGKVVYGFNDPKFAIKSDTIKNKLTDFAGSYIGSNCVDNATATIFFNNNTTKTLRFNLCDEIAKTKAENALVGSMQKTVIDFTPLVTVDYVKQRGGTKWYNFKITPQGIDSFKDQISKFSYEYNHHTLRDRESTDEKNNFSVGYRGWGCVTDLVITMHYKDEDDNPQKLSKTINMCTAIGWEDLAEGDHRVSDERKSSKRGKIEK